MSAIPSSTAGATSSRGNQELSNALSNVDTDQFLQLMIQELQNQDPLNPQDSAQFLQQITQIREIGASDRLTSTLDSVLQGQNLTTASGLIGKEITALTDFGDQVQGVVDRVSVDVDDELGNRTLNIHIGEQTVSLKNVRSIVEQEA